MVFQRRRPSVDIDRRVEGLQVEALQCMIPGEAATPLNQAGDLLLRSGDAAGALELYGQAVDSLVEADRFEAAMGLCNKIIRTVPHVVRARCTLAWLAIGAGFTGELSGRVGDYVSAAEACGREIIAQRHVWQMAHMVDVHDVRIMLGEYLLYLGDDRAADHLFGEIYSERNTGRTRSIDQEERWRGVREAALMNMRKGAAMVA
ncbi:MAG TPA: hypothetical protein VHG09_02015 [Longimicrobiales bacterium]|nr:hypothetical protein [Longimicrobiales bacterium]